MLKKQKPTFNPARFDSKSFKSLTESIQNISEAGSSSGGPMSPGFGTKPSRRDKINRDPLHPSNRGNRGRTVVQPTPISYYKKGLGASIGIGAMGRMLVDLDQAVGPTSLLKKATILGAISTVGPALLKYLTGGLLAGATSGSFTPGAPSPSGPKSFPKPF